MPSPRRSSLARARATALIAALASMTLGCEAVPLSVPMEGIESPSAGVRAIAGVSSLLFSEDFEGYAEGSDLVGQGGWTLIPSLSVVRPLLVGTGPLGSRSLHGLTNPGVQAQQFVQHPTGWDGTGMVSVTTDSYMDSSFPRSHNSGIWLGPGTDHSYVAAWWSDCGVGCRLFATDPPGWFFDARGVGGGLEIFPGQGYDTPVRLEIVVDATTQEMFGRADFGAGVMETNHYSTTGVDLSTMTSVAFLQDFRGTRGGDWDNIVVTWTPPILPIRLDIKPGSEPNSILCHDGNGSIPVAILTTADFDATTVDHATVTFGPSSAREIHQYTTGVQRHEEDVDGDGDTDLVFHFRFGDTGISCGDTEARLAGQTFDGTRVEGTDAVRLMGGND